MDVNTKIKSYLRLVPAGLYSGLIWYISSMELPIKVGSYDKTLHLLEYAGLGLLLAYGFNLNKKNFDTAAKQTLLFGIIIGISDEVHQYFVPGRSFDILDFFTDSVGISGGILIFFTLVNILSFFKQK